MFSQWLQLSTVSCALFSLAHALQLPQYTGLKTRVNGSLLEVTLHNPSSEINLWNNDTQYDLSDLVSRLQKDNETKVVVFKSETPRYFMAHLDLTMPNLVEILPAFNELIYNISVLPQVTIGVVEGRARGAGNELLLALDMRFATKKDTLFGQLEVGSGIIPGGGGSQFLPGLIGRGLAMEYILTSKDITAAEAEKIGWINKAFDNRKKMNAYVNTITSRLQLFPRTALVAAKKSVNRRTAPTLEDVRLDGEAFAKQLADPALPAIAAKSAALAGNRSAFEVELNIGDNLPLLYT